MQTSPTRFNNLQILRLFAAIGVALFHLGVHSALSMGVSDGPVPWLKMPLLASAWVPMFFALSGFVLTHTLQRAPPGRYLLARLVRIYPGYWLAIALVMVVAFVGLWPGGHVNMADPHPKLRSLTLLPTRKVSAGQYPLVVEWTLIYEVFLSVSLLVLRMIAGRKRLAIAAGAWLVVLAVKSVLWPLYGNRSIPRWTDIWASTYLAPFFLGVLAYELRDRGRHLRWVALALAAGFTVVAGEWVTFERNEPHLWLRGSAAALTVWFLVQIRDASPRNPLVVGGGYSYGLYLIHMPVVLLTIRAIQVTGTVYGTWIGVGIAAVVVLSLGLAYGRLEEALYVRAKRISTPTSPRARATACVGRSTA